MKEVQAYRKALKRMEDADREYQAALDATDAALLEKRAHEVPGLRNAQTLAYRRLAEQHSEALQAHRAYWRARMAEIAPQLQLLGRLAREYDLYARAAGDLTRDPWRLVVDEERLKSIGGDAFKEMCGDDVPIEAPYCDNL